MDRIRSFVWRFRWFFGPVAVVVIAIAVRVMWSGYHDLAIADDAREAGLQQTAIDHYGSAARWYLPVLGAHNAAFDRLMDMCWEIERSGANEMALRCFREARGAVLSTRWLFNPRQGILDNANGAIARIAATETGPDGEPVLTEDAHLELLERDLTPNPWMSLAAVILFLSWVGVAGLGAWRSTTRDGVVDFKRFAVHMAMSGLLLVLWLLVLRFA